MADKDNTDNKDEDFNFKLPDGFGKQMYDAMESISKAYAPLLNASSQWVESINQAQKSLAKAIGGIDFTGIAKIAETISKSIDGHFPDNWPKGKMGECADLCVQGVPIVFVPRKSVVNRIVRAKNMSAIKRIVVHSDAAIIEDCKKVIDESTWLSKDMRKHIQESIDCYNAKQYRAAQSTACVAYDSILNEIVDMRKLRRADRGRRKSRLSHSVVKGLTDIERFKNDLMELPLRKVPFYTLLMFPVIGKMVMWFELGDKTSYTNDINRHMSIHTVSSKQYKQSNALLAIMTLASICKVTQIRGKNWMQSTAQTYGVTLA